MYQKSDYAAATDEEQIEQDIKNAPHAKLAKLLEGTWELARYETNVGDILNDYNVKIRCKFVEYDGSKGKADIEWKSPERLCVVTYDFMFYGEDGIVLENPRSIDDPSVKKNYKLYIENLSKDEFQMKGVEFSLPDQKTYQVDIVAQRP